MVYKPEDKHEIRHRQGVDHYVPSCVLIYPAKAIGSIPCDYFPRRNYPLFQTSKVLEALAATV